ncbi:MAG: TPM domain-containing protein [Acidobacteria bacterium]|nr:TPM domain-containing protein [Acidobacteriota bacterium]MBV9185793.1 TPM domain-containing protein [Acidobacteriota bacterium]
MLAFVLALATTITVPPKPATYVTDKAGVLNAARAHVLNEKLAQFERDTSNQILVYVDRTLPTDSTIEQFANDAMHQWGVGQKGKDNGAVLFLFTGDRKMRIEVGYGLEGVLTDAKSKQITSTIIKPRLKAADYDGAVEQGVDGILAAVRGEGLKGTGKTAHESKSLHLAPAVLPCSAIFVAVLILVIVIIVKSRKRGVPGRTWTTPDAAGNSSPWSSLSSSSSDSFSDSSSSSSDSSFDGGGGDSGGGGSSDSW